MTIETRDAQDRADNDSAPGWIAIDSALARLYPGQEPKHYGTLIKWRLGGRDPLDGISAWKRESPLPHWHFVTYGLTELYSKESANPAVSGFGFELTFRVACDANDDEPPRWALSFLQNLARYVFQSGNAFKDGHWMTANGPIALDTATALCSMGFAFDPELMVIDTPHGSVVFLQIVGLTVDEERAAKRWNTRRLLDTLLPHMPMWVTDIGRESLLERASVRAHIDECTRRDGSSSGSLFTDVLAWQARKRLMRAPVVEITIGARQIDELVALLPLRLPFDRPFWLRSRDGELQFLRGNTNEVIDEGRTLTLRLNDATVQAFSLTLQPRVGEYAVNGLDSVRWRVEKTVIRDAQGNSVQTIG